MRQPIHAELARYRRTWGKLPRFDEPGQKAFAERIESFVDRYPDYLERTQKLGHLTGSAVITTRSLDRVLLTLHRKLGKWLQLGGHADGNPSLAEVALREAQEESGLGDFHFLPCGGLFADDSPTPLIFDLDIHEIPARQDEPDHLHYDVRYLLVAEHPERIQLSEESHDLRWFTLEEAYALTAEPSMHRQFDKLAYVKQQLDPDRQSTASSRD